MLAGNADNADCCSAVSGCQLARWATLLRGRLGSGESFDSREGSDATVFDDESEDRLQGSSGSDWLFANEEDDKVKAKLDEEIEDLFSDNED